MKHLLIWLAVACACVAVHAIVCPPNICDQVRCDTTITEENCCGVFKPNGGFCGCCPLCVTIIPPGGKCIVIRGVPSSSECAEGTRCNNGTCQALDQPL
ncbi:fungal protease inhibitor-1-like [Thrips palmi]|uniref:Fungal protease inhibitor-1-like n=1 Tax=Thrips palmi TaxID=161013 RepID=A0A6P9A2S5_THRPL|nr:fungal protease inhibitor-1-like [Thrips palmi]